METWIQNYSAVGDSLILTAAVALLPIIFFFVALTVLKMKGYVAGFCTLLIALGVAILAFGMPAGMALSSALYGFAYGLWPIAWIIITAVFLYKITVKTGQFNIIRASVISITEDQRLQMLLVGFSFGAFLEGAAGFGAPVAITASLLSFALGGSAGWLSSAGYIGPKVKVAHDISLLVPEIFSRMTPRERDARTLIEAGFLQRLEDFDYEGRRIEASRLGYRMNEAFAATYFGRIFLHPDVVFTEEMLRPELQDPGIFADSVEVIVATHQTVAKHYVDDGSIQWAVPPLRALLEIMYSGRSAEGWTLASPEFRALFERENILASDWYAARVDAKVERDRKQAEASIRALTRFTTTQGNDEVTTRLDIEGRLSAARAWLDRGA